MNEVRRDDPPTTADPGKWNLPGTDRPTHDMADASESGRLYSRVREDQADPIREALMQTGGNKTRAAKLLGMTSRQFRYRLEKLNIDA